MDSQIHQNIGPYFIHDELFPRNQPIYFGRHEKTGKEAVLKVAVPMDLGEDHNPRAVGEICLEYEHSLQSRVKHPLICPVEGPILEYNREKYLVTPRTGQGNLADYVKAHRMPKEELIALLGNVACALVYCHTKDVVHLDVKPQNVLVDRKRAVLIDFGSAREANNPHPIADQILSVTLDSAAPEYALNRVFTKRSDTFSLAVMAYRQLTEDEPFKKLGDNICYDRPKYQPKKLEEYKQLGKLIIAGLNIEQVQRPDMTELADALMEQAAKPRPQPNEDSLILSPASA
jgi:serine/threonine protein kinase